MLPARLPVCEMHTFCAVDSEIATALGTGRGRDMLREPAWDVAMGVVLD